MNANDVIESYVTDVAVRLPRKQRNDVAFELRSLLNEELHARAEAAGRDVDVNTTIEFLQTFGRPADVAAQYRPTLTIIDPADGPLFLRMTAIGLVIIWSLGLLESLRQPVHPGGDLLPHSAIGGHPSSFPRRGGRECWSSTSAPPLGHVADRPNPACGIRERASVQSEAAHHSSSESSASCAGH